MHRNAAEDLSTAIAAGSKVAFKAIHQSVERVNERGQQAEQSQVAEEISESMQPIHSCGDEQPGNE